MTIAREPIETPLAKLPRNLLDALQAAGVDTLAIASGLGLSADSLETGMTFVDADRFFCAAWDAVGLLRAENKGLKERIGTLEQGVEDVIGFVGGRRCRS